MREMKDSGIEWIGNVPNTWTRSKIKNACSMIGSGTTPDSHIVEYYESGTINWIQSGDIYGKDYIKNVSVKVTDLSIKTLGALKLYKAPFITIAMYGGSVGNIAISLIDACANQACCCLRPANWVDFKYLFYWITFCKADFLSKAEGGGQPNISQDKIKNQWFYAPEIAEQNIIANYLEKKNSEYKATVFVIQAEIKTLEEYKQSIISEAVTKGLNRQVEMRESGIRWVSHLPAHWPIIPSKYLFRDSDVRKQAGDVQLTASQKYGIISQEEYMERENAKVVLANQGLDDWKHVEPYDFVISLRSFQGGLEMSETTGCITWHYVVLKATKPIYPKFYKWLFKSSMYITAIQRTCNFIRDGQDLRYSNFSQVPLYEPPLEEQKEIADYLDKKCAEIDAVIATKQKQLETLDAYKKSLIFEYVTGKKVV